MLLVIAVVSLSGFDYAVRRERDAASRTRLAGKQPRPRRGDEGAGIRKDALRHRDRSVAGTRNA
jgi:hypothetical protein